MSCEYLLGNPNYTLVYSHRGEELQYFGKANDIREFNKLLDDFLV